MALPLAPPLPPQLARSRSSLPDDGEVWAYEPKWDGFRCIAFVDGEDVFLQSRSGKPLARYFPELSFPAGRYVVDGEIVIFNAGGGTEFDLLGQRIHPAASRVERLSVETPGTFVAFDLLARDDETLLELPYIERRAALEALVAEPLMLTPMVLTAAEAEPWLHSTEGVIAKERAAAYLPGERKGMAKVKRVRTIDAVIVGWRPGKAEGTLGALILGLYTPDGDLRVVGHSSGFTAKQKRELPDQLAPFESGDRGTGDASRWKSDKELEWIGLRPELVVEVTFDQVSDGRIRHGAKVARWRDDKAPAECTVDQLDS
ncbi:DNA ligase C1 [Paraconexibacter sp. AEG42_29]|uniref:DNA ligase (ATP) n=1 Tax=Paraconexibacter sp. AEG42_29 TaxID=2997339 RepID=A0AAU7B2I0_9ACTN